jgi:hypothetical protein
MNYTAIPNRLELPQKAYVGMGKCAKSHGLVQRWDIVRDMSKDLHCVQGGDAAEGTCPLCRGNLCPAKLFSPAQLQPPAPAPQSESAPESSSAAGAVDAPLEEELFVSSTKLDACADKLLESLQ